MAAEIFVLAANAIETPRLMLMSAGEAHTPLVFGNSSRASPTMRWHKTSPRQKLMLNAVLNQSIIMCSLLVVIHFTLHPDRAASRHKCETIRETQLYLTGIFRLHNQSLAF